MVRASRSALAQSSAATVEELRELYAWDEPDVWQMLQLHPEVLDPLIQAASLAPRYFGPVTVMSLRVVHDVDGYGPDELFAYIHTSLPPEEALDSLERFEREWWLDVMPSLIGVLSFGLRFQ